MTKVKVFLMKTFVLESPTAVEVLTLHNNQSNTTFLSMFSSLFIASLLILLKHNRHTLNSDIDMLRLLYSE